MVTTVATLFPLSDANRVIICCQHIMFYEPDTVISSSESQWTNYRPGFNKIKAQLT